jgi:hypothetical protein
VDKHARLQERRGSLLLHRNGLPPPAPCRSPGASDSAFIWSVTPRSLMERRKCTAIVTSDRRRRPDLRTIAMVTQKSLGKTRHRIAHEVMRADVRELANRARLFRQRPPTAAERVVLAEIVPGFLVDQTIEEGEEIGTRVGRVVSRRVVGFGGYGDSALISSAMRRLCKTSALSP